MYTQSLQRSFNYIRQDKNLVALIVSGSLILQVILERVEALEQFQNSELLIPLKLVFSIIHIWMFLILLRKLKAFSSGQHLPIKLALTEALVSAPSFILYSILYIFLVLAGLFLFIVPGLYFLGGAYFIPFFAALDIESEGTFLEDSRKLSHQHIPFVWGISLSSLILELGLEMKGSLAGPFSEVVLWILIFLIILCSMILFLWGGSFTLEMKGKLKTT